MLVCYRGKSYDAEELADLGQQKCVAYLFRNASDFTRTRKVLLRDALVLLAIKPQIDATDDAAKANAL